MVLRPSSMLFLRWCKIRPLSAIPEAEMMIMGSFHSFSALDSSTERV